MPACHRHSGEIQTYRNETLPLASRLFLPCPFYRPPSTWTFLLTCAIVSCSFIPQFCKHYWKLFLVCAFLRHKNIRVSSPEICLTRAVCHPRGLPFYSWQLVSALLYRVLFWSYLVGCKGTRSLCRDVTFSQRRTSPLLRHKGIVEWCSNHLDHWNNISKAFIKYPVVHQSPAHNWNPPPKQGHKMME